MKIACLGWGSLIWDPRDLPIILPWKTDGPHLPLEFARQSINGRLTLALAPNAVPVPTLWALLDVRDTTEAIEALRIREGAGKLGIGIWPSANAPHEIAAFASQKELSAVVWTALTPKFGGASNVTPSVEEAVAYLNGLEGEARNAAEEYIRRAPIQIATKYRKIFEEKLGWVPLY